MPTRSPKSPRKRATAGPRRPSRQDGAGGQGRVKPKRTATRSAYHHGNLRQALIDMAVEMAAEGEPESVTVREVGRRLGVSSGAPFRHFGSREALLGAVAAEALRRFHDATRRALAAVASDDPVERLRATGHAFIQWALRNPTHFRILSARRLIRFEEVPELRDDVQAVANAMTAITAQAQQRGQWPECNTQLLVLVGRALVYGLSRMKVDGQLAQWGVDEDDSEPALLAALDLYVDLMVQAARLNPLE